MNVNELKVDATDLRLLGYMTAGTDIKDMLAECVRKIENGELINDRKQLLDFLKK